MREKTGENRAGRPDGGEGGLHLALHHGIDAQHRGAGGALHGLARLAVQRRLPLHVPHGDRRGPRALDIYTTDMDGVLAELSAAGWLVSGPGTISVGPVTMRQALVVGPDGLPVVLVESTHRRSSLLDEFPDRRCSDPHSVVWCVDDLDADSLALIELVEALEEELGERSVGFRIEDEDLVDLKTVRDAVDYVYDRVKGA